MTAKINQSLKDFELIVFGGEGDLAFRKIYPALYHRLAEGQISERSRILAVSRKEPDLFEFRDQLETHLNSFVVDIDATVLASFLGMFSIGMIDTAAKKQNAVVDQWFNKSVFDVRVFYLATPATAFGLIAKYLDEKGIYYRILQSCTRKTTRN